MEMMLSKPTWPYVKSNWPINVITGCVMLEGGNCCHLAFEITGNQPCTHCGGIFVVLVQLHLKCFFVGFFFFLHNQAV